MPLPIEDYLVALRREGDALAAAAAGAGLGSAVPPCPEWNVADLLWHTGEVHHFWARIAEDRPDDPRAVAEPARPPDDELAGWYRSELDELERVLRSTDPATPCWTWAGPQTVAWIVRRMAQETAVHRWDAEAAGGTPSPIEAALAVDGIDEFLEFFATAAATLDGTVHLHATDAEGEWLLRLAGDDLQVERGHAKGDAAVRGTASDLLLGLWRRVPLTRLELFGDAGLAQGFVDAQQLD